MPVHRFTCWAAAYSRERAEGTGPSLTFRPHAHGRRPLRAPCRRVSRKKNITPVTAAGDPRGAIRSLAAASGTGCRSFAGSPPSSSTSSRAAPRMLPERTALSSQLSPRGFAGEGLRGALDFVDVPSRTVTASVPNAPRGSDTVQLGSRSTPHEYGSRIMKLNHAHLHPRHRRSLAQDLGARPSGRIVQAQSRDRDSRISSPEMSATPAYATT